MRKWIFSVLVSALLVGILQGWLPSTFFVHPIVTVHAMQDFPIGSKVEPADKVLPLLFQDSELKAWSHDNCAVITGYEMTSWANGDPLLLFHIRLRDSGSIHAINYAYVKRVKERDQIISSRLTPRHQASSSGVHIKLFDWRASLAQQQKIKTDAD